MHDTSFTIMTANVAAGLAPVSSIAAAIRAGSPDIVALVELPRDEAEQLDEMLAAWYPYTVFIADRNEGRGLLSRFPVRDYRPVEVASGRPDLVSSIAMPGQDLTVVVAHPRPQRVTRTGLLFSFSSLRQMMHLARIASDRAPAVLLGDLNMSPRHPGYRRLVRMGLQDAWTASNHVRGSTFPTR
ncbi:MAG TPA: endonuclease/exonuclease/phosphatase family protein, partial [Thermomicrobiales bacterium]|nr:endonuclease/exonuclease/phosphatase family protein [Thermomicrobiales bacterium]